ATTRRSIQATDRCSSSWSIRPPAPNLPCASRPTSGCYRLRASSRSFVVPQERRGSDAGSSSDGHLVSGQGTVPAVPSPSALSEDFVALFGHCQRVFELDEAAPWVEHRRLHRDDHACLEGGCRVHPFI